MVQAPIKDHQVRFLHGGLEPATALNQEQRPRTDTRFIPGAKGRIETITVEPEFPSAELPALYFLVGWWGSAWDYVETMEFFSRLGFRTRCFSWRGTGLSGGWTFFGSGLENDLIRVLQHFQDGRIVLINHSGAIDPLRRALRILWKNTSEESRGVITSIAAAIFVAPLSRSGTMGALMQWLRPDGSGTDLTRWARFLGSNVFGLAWFMRNELALRRVLLSDKAPVEVVWKVWNQIGPCAYGRYFLSLCRFPRFVQYSPRPLSDFGLNHTLLLHAEFDRNFSSQQQCETAQAIGAEFGILPATCHQWFAEELGFRTTVLAMAEWLQKKRILPAERDFIARVRALLSVRMTRGIPTWVQ
jgi:pimeloyl-ACP methyl ester carboxylesterase